MKSQKHPKYSHRSIHNYKDKNILKSITNGTFSQSLQASIGNSIHNKCEDLLENRDTHGTQNVENTKNMKNSQTAQSVNNSGLPPIQTTFINPMNGEPYTVKPEHLKFMNDPELRTSKEYYQNMSYPGFPIGRSPPK